MENAMLEIPLTGQKKPVVPKSIIELHHIIITFVIMLGGTLIYNGF